MSRRGGCKIKREEGRGWRWGTCAGCCQEELACEEGRRAIAIAVVATASARAVAWTVGASAIKAYCCTARITLGYEIILKLWVYICQPHH
jgi:hypothetical protein